MSLIEFRSPVPDVLGREAAETPPWPADAFTARRELLVEQGRWRPMLRLASFLIFLSNDRARNGLDRTIIADDLRCCVIAELLKLSMAELELSLVALQTHGLICPTASGGLQITDFAGLERIAEEHGSPVEITAAHAWIEQDR